MEPILISACLLGAACRYDGGSKPVLSVEALMGRYQLVPVCPEQLGGLPTPREPSERQGDLVVMKSGADVTAQYQRGAEQAFDAANLEELWQSEHWGRESTSEQRRQDLKRELHDIEQFLRQ